MVFGMLTKTLYKIVETAQNPNDPHRLIKLKIAEVIGRTAKFTSKDVFTSPTVKNSGKSHILGKGLGVKSPKPSCIFKKLYSAFSRESDGSANIVLNFIMCR